MDLVVVGSSPITHPSPMYAALELGLFLKTDAFVAQLDRATDFESVGRRFDSCRTHGACGLFGPLAQLAEQQTLNLRVAGSMPARLIWTKAGRRKPPRFYPESKKASFAAIHDEALTPEGSAFTMRRVDNDQESRRESGGMADTLDLGSSALRREGSSPFSRMSG